MYDLLLVEYYSVINYNILRKKTNPKPTLSSYPLKEGSCPSEFILFLFESDVKIRIFHGRDYKNHSVRELSKPRIPRNTLWYVRVIIKFNPLSTIDSTYIYQHSRKVSIHSRWVKTQSRDMQKLCTPITGTFDIVCGPRETKWPS